MISVTTFQKLIGRPPKQSEMEEIHRRQDALNLRDDDAMLLLLIAMESHKTLLEAAPEALIIAINNFSKKAIQVAEAETKLFTQKILADLSNAVAEASKTVAHETSKKSRAQWVAGASAVLTICFICIAYVGFSVGQKSGFADARDEIAAASWSNTADGKAARMMWQRGDLRVIMSCDLPGWVIKDGSCFPQKAANGQYGWRLP